METGQRKSVVNKAGQKTLLGFQRPKILIAREGKPHAVGRLGFKGAQVLLARVDGKEIDNGFKTDVERQIPGGGVLVREIRVLLERMTSEGKSIGKVLKEKNLDKDERRIVYVYIWRKDHITQEEAAKTLGIKKVTLTHKVKRIENKLLGLDSYYHLLRRYIALSDRELEIEIKWTGAKSKVEVNKMDPKLYKVATRRGVLARMFPPLSIKKLNSALKTARQKRSLKKILADLEDFDRNIINEIALSKAPLSIKAFARKHELKPDKVLRRIKKLTKQLRGEEVYNGNASNLLKKCIEDLDGDKLTELKSLLDEKELALLERRALPKEGESFDSIGKTFPVTRQRMKQKENELLGKIERWKRGGRFERFERKKPEWPRIKRIKKLVETRRSKGETIDEIKRNSRLNELESQVTDLCVLNENRITQREAAERLGTTPSTISKILKSVEDKLTSVEKT